MEEATTVAEHGGFFVGQVCKTLMDCDAEVFKLVLKAGGVLDIHAWVSNPDGSQDRRSAIFGPQTLRKGKAKQ